MKKVFLSLPMKGRTDEAIQETITKMEDFVKIFYPNETIEFMHNFNPLITKEIERINASQPNMIKKEPLWYLSYAIKQMAQCDIFVQIDDYIGEWNYKGVIAECQLARDYGIKILKLPDNDGYFLPDIKAEADEAASKFREPAPNKGRDVSNAPSVGIK